jgi:hypothetical protein
MGGGLRVGVDAIAFSEMKRDLIERALFPLFSLRQPENPALGIVSRTLPAHRFLAANLHELVHKLHSGGVKPTSPRILAESEPESLNFALWKTAVTLSLRSHWNHLATQHIYDSRVNNRAGYAVRLSHPCRANHARRVELKLQGSGEGMPAPITP